MAKIRIGRSSSNDVVLKDTTVSRSHAEIEDIGGGQYRITDVGSSAGTFLKQGDTWSQITSAEVGPDAVVRFGEAEVKVSDIVNTDPATVAPRASGGLGQRAEKSAAELSQQGAPGTGGSGAGASGGGWSSLSPNYKIGIIVGGGVFVLLIVIALVLSLAGEGGPGGGLIGGGGPGGGTIGSRVPGGGPGGEGSGGRASSSAAKARLHQALLASCAKRGQGKRVCSCIANNIVGGISDADAQAIFNAQRSGGKPSPGVMRKFLASAFAAGRACAKRARGE